MCPYILAVFVLASGQQAVPAGGPPKRSEFLSPQEVEGEAKGALVTVLAYFAESDKDLKTLLMTRDELASKLKKLKDTGEAPRSVEKMKRDLSNEKAAVLTKQVSLVDALVPSDRFNTYQDAVQRPPDFRLARRSETKAEEARKAATELSRLLQFVDNDYRAVLKRVRSLESRDLKIQEALKLAEDATDKQTLQRKEKDIRHEIDAAGNAAIESRRALLRRLIDEINEDRGVPPVRLYWFSRDR